MQAHDDGCAPDDPCGCSDCAGVWGFDVEPICESDDGARWTFAAATPAERREAMRAIRVQLDEILRRLQRAEDDRTPPAPHR